MDKLPHGGGVHNRGQEAGHGNPFRLGDPERCGLVIAKHQRRTPKTAHYRRRCHNLGCTPCGDEDSSRWSHQHRPKGAVIGDAIVGFLLPWPDIGLNQSSREEVVAFLAAVSKLAETLEKRADLDGFALVSQYNPPPGGERAKLQPHVHCAILPGAAGAMGVWRWASREWKRLGGRALGPDLIRPRNLLGFINYTDTHPLQGLKTRDRLLWNAVVFRQVEATVEQTAAPRFVGGRALDAYGFQCVRARARWQWVRREDRRARRQMSITQRFAHPDSKMADYCPRLKKLEHVPICPECMGYGAMVAVQDDPERSAMTCRCKNRKCRHTWVDEPVFAGQRRGHRAARLNNKIRRAFKRTKDVAAVAKELEITEAAVLAGIARSPKSRKRSRFNTPEPVSASA